ncbi:MAG: NAD(P)/FAD-dependent oxidoreductase [Lachnospiraceae bacterium]|nr:NAD(P)/FAD-dependent oxidoreductase [Lachnospiraceae bacterium]
MRYDIAVIGGGPAGYSAAFEAAARGMSVVLFEYGELGGTCLNRGCVPTKYLAHAAGRYHDAVTCGQDGISFDGVKLDHNRMVSRMNEIVGSLREGLTGELSGKGITVIKGEASVLGAGLVGCGGESFEASGILIATGSGSSKPLISGAITSDELLKLKTIPKKLHILGGGTVAVEFAEIFSMLGSSVTISVRGERILRGWDKEIAVSLSRSLKSKGVRINTGCDLTAIKCGDDETVLSAAGRLPVLPDIAGGLVEISEDGGIVADENGCTSTPGIYAAGDVLSGSLKLAHTSMEQGRRAIRHIAGENVGPEAVPVRCIYAGQEAASVGCTEAEADNAVSAKQSMLSNARTVISSGERGFVKIVADPKTHRVIGAQLMCERAGDMVPELALAIDRGLTVDEMLYSVRPHPSYSEAVTGALRNLSEKIDAL